MVRMRSWIVLGLSLSLVAVCTPLLAQEPCTITVRPGESIQAAIDAAPEGSAICLTEGVWHENITISRSIVLRGSDPHSTCIHATQAGTPVLRIYSSGKGIVVAIENLRVEDGSPYPDGCGILVEGSVEASITRVSSIDNRGHGIEVRGVAWATISQCYVARNSDGISLKGQAVATVLDCEVSSNRGDGVVLQDSSRATITGQKPPSIEDPAPRAYSLIQRNVGSGIRLADRAEGTILECTVSENEGVGIVVEGSVHATITGGWAYRNGQDGVALYNRCLATLSDVKIQSNGTGLFGGAGISVSHTAQATIRGCDIRANRDYGVVVRERPCADTSLTFTGCLTGGENKIQANGKGETCPAVLDFLTAAVGGSFYPLTVQPGQSVATVVDRAPTGSVVFVPRGTWDEDTSIGITKSITLRGADLEQTFVRSKSSPVLFIEVKGEDVVIEGLSLMTTPGHVLNDAIVVESSGGSRIRIKECIVYSNPRNGYWVRSGIGASIGQEDRLEVVDCMIVGVSNWGVLLGGKGTGSVVGCTIWVSWDGEAGDLGLGILLYGELSALLERNDIHWCKAFGIALDDPPCPGFGFGFQGSVTGRGNSGAGNVLGDVCPAAIGFLFTDQGGTLDMRE